MTDPSPLNGQCLCGAVTIEVTPKTGIGVCHCDMCRKWVGGPFFSLHGVSSDSVTITGEEHVTRFKSSDWAERAFCSRCGSNLWFHFIPAGHLNFMAGLFDLPAEFTIDEQIFVDQMPAWAELAAESSRKTGAEVIAEAEAAGFTFD